MPIVSNQLFLFEQASSQRISEQQQRHSSFFYTSSSRKNLVCPPHSPTDTATMTTNQGMQGLIAIVNKLQDAFAHLGMSPSRMLLSCADPRRSVQPPRPPPDCCRGWPECRQELSAGELCGQVRQCQMYASRLMWSQRLPSAWLGHRHAPTACAAADPPRGPRWGCSCGCLHV